MPEGERTAMLEQLDTRQVGELQYQESAQVGGNLEMMSHLRNKTKTLQHCTAKYYANIRSASWNGRRPGLAS